jgi:hypothetical protein
MNPGVFAAMAIVALLGLVLALASVAAATSPITNSSLGEGTARPPRNWVRAAIAVLKYKPTNLSELARKNLHHWERGARPRLWRWKEHPPRRHDPVVGCGVGTGIVSMVAT